MFVTNSKKGFSVKAYRGDAKTLLAFNMPQAKAKDLAGFTIYCSPKNNPSYYLFNALQFKDAKQHFQDKKEHPFSSLNAPFQKFQWLHVPGQFHQQEKIFYGSYDYTVTPRYFKDGKMQQIDNSLSVSVTVDVLSFTKDFVEVGFTRGFVQSQAFVHHFGLDALISPKGEKNAFFNTTDIAGKVKGKPFTFRDEYAWSGFTAREKIFSILNEVVIDKTLNLDVFAYDLYEPDFSAQIFQLAKEGRVRIILDNATLHHTATGKLVEDQFEAQFKKIAKKGADIKRGKFSRFSHSKVLVVRKGKNALKVLTGSTNFSITGIYVNSNHVVIFNDPNVAQSYAEVFNESWKDNVSIAFSKSPLSNKTFSFNEQGVGKIDINFSPHKTPFVTAELQKIADRVAAERKSVLFAVMDVTDGSGALLPVLQTLHASGKVFSFGISDSAGTDLTLYKPGVKSGILVSGKTSGILPPPFDKEKSIGIGHQIHHKFIVCDFNGADAVVFCGSSNLSQGGEEENGDNLVAIYDTDIATVFAIEALGLVDHFNFRNKFGTTIHPANANIVAAASESAKKAFIMATASAEVAGTFRPMTLAETSNWTNSYYSEENTHCQERSLLA
jgi:phosphatidylserine/phosphatidylglycerophosphate/cardiolipin synthase-like enzyme